MKKINIKFSSFVLLFVLLLSQVIWAEPADLAKIEQYINENAAYMLKQTPDLQVGSVGGEWTAMDLARSGYDVPEDFYQRYYKVVEKYVKKKKGNLHKRKYTEYSRVILALTAIGKDPHDVAGYDLINPLGDYERVIYQGINGPIFALIALDSGNYEMPYCEEARVHATREMYIRTILSKQIPLDDGFSLDGRKGDPDITGMALQALAPYKSDPDVAAAIDKALVHLSKTQNADGGYSSWGAPNSESVVQVIVALTALGIDPNDERFVKNGHTMMDNLLTYYHAGGGFMHVRAGDQNNGGAAAGTVDGMATDQGMYGFIAYRNFYRGKNHFYDMSDVQKKTATEQAQENKDVKLGSALIPKIKAPNKQFSDISNSPYKEAILALASREILNGISDNQFAPKRFMTRAEFCTMIVKAMQLKTKGEGLRFSDVKKDDWYYKYINIAYANNLVKGKSTKIFDPNGKITRQEAAMLLYNSAEVLGMDKNIARSESNIYLPSYLDYAKIPAWSKDALTFSVKYKMIDINKTEIKPTEYITRGELSFMTYQLLLAAGL